MFQIPNNDNRISYTETHIPLQKGIDDCIDDMDNNGLHGGVGVSSLTPMLADHERNPDLIPRGKENPKVMQISSLGKIDSRQSQIDWKALGFCGVGRGRRFRPGFLDPNEV